MPACAPNAVEKLASTEMWSSISVELTLSIPRPPYSSGTSTAVNPSSAALRSIAAIAPGSFASIAAMRGKISSRANRSAVAAICRCSSLRSSGVKTSSGVRDSIRKLPPAAATIGDGSDRVHWREGPPTKSDPKKACPMRPPYASASSLRNRCSRLALDVRQLASRFKQEPRPPLSFVDPNLDQTRCRVVVGVGRNFVRLAEALHQRSIIRL